MKYPQTTSPGTDWQFTAKSASIRDSRRDDFPGQVKYSARMAFPKPSYTRSQVNRAAEFWGKLPVAEFDRSKMVEAYEVINNWRLGHNYPINTFQMTLRQRLKKIDSDAIVAQRLKRFFSIVSKLRRIHTMKLSNMQDIAGLRAIVHNTQQVRELRNCYVNSDKRYFTHELVNEYDYVTNPKASGYRSVHLVYRYRNRKISEYDGLLIELQIRTRLQHAWATSVETLGTFLDHALKASEGPAEWLNFFSLTGSSFAHLEHSPPVPEYEALSARETFAATIANADALHVRERLQSYAIAADEISRTGSGDTYHLIILDPVKKSTTIKSFSRIMLEEANQEYAEIEKQISDGKDIQAVLVSAGPIKDLQRAYPNFFLDTHEFIAQLDRLKQKV